MRRMRSGFQTALMVVGMVWLAAWLFINAKAERATVPRTSCVVAGLPAPLIMISTMDQMPDGKVLRQEIRAVRIGPNGGVLLCGPALLVVPPNAVPTSARFCLEDFSNHMPCVELAGFAADLSRPSELHISYLGTPYDGSGFDLSALKIYRQTSPDEYQVMPSHVDLEQGCVVAQVTETGLYVIA